MYIVETEQTGSREPALQFVGDRDEIMAFNECLIPFALGTLAGGDLVIAGEVEQLLEDIGRHGTLTFFTNRCKPAAIAIFGRNRQYNLTDRRYAIAEGAAKGNLTSSQVREEIAMLGRLARQPGVSWLTPQGLGANPEVDSLLVDTYEKPADDSAASPWGELRLEHLELAEQLGATHLAFQYELAFEPGEPHPTPVLRSPQSHLQLGTKDGESFQPLATILAEPYTQPHSAEY